MNKKRVAWISATCFLDTDIYIVSLLGEYFQIDWYIMLTEKERFGYTDEMKRLEGTVNSINYVDVGRRLSSRDAIGRNMRFLRGIRDAGYDLIYTAMANMPYYPLALAATQDSRRVILGIHNVKVIRGGAHPVLERIYSRMALVRFKNFHAYSRTQYEVLMQRAPRKRNLYAPFIPKDYGKATHTRADSRITFLGFGNIGRYKRFDVLIRAAQKAYEETGIRFRVIIAGTCNNWEDYQRLITNDDLFELHIGRVPNKDIPELFAEADYSVVPYQDIAQSGALMVAVNYEKPVLASHLKVFEEYIEEGENGYFFKPADVDGLSERMVYVLTHHDEVYLKLKVGAKRAKNTKFSSERITKMYADFFDKVYDAYAAPDSKAVSR